MVIKTKIIGRTSGGSYTRQWDNRTLYGTPKTMYELQDTSYSAGPPYVQPNNWFHTKDQDKPAVQNGVYKFYPNSSTSIYNISYNNWPLFYCPRLLNPNFSDAYHQSMVTSALAQSNPSTPVFDLPLFLFELRELPKGLRDLGNTLMRAKKGKLLPGDPGGAYLSWSFGWKPLISDLISMVNLAEATNDRLDYLKNAANAKRIHGNLPGGESSAVYQQGSGTVRWEWTVHSTVRRWYSATYVMDPDQLAELDQGGLSRAKWALGLKGINYSTLWNAMPWSWLIDYFSNVGDFIEAQQGYYKASITNMCTMAEYKNSGVVSNYWYTSPKSADLRITGNSDFLIQTRKVHPIPVASPSFEPFLSGKQKSILLALATSRSSSFLKGG